MSTVSFVEASIVPLVKLGGAHHGPDLVRALRIDVLETNARQMQVAVDVYVRYGKGRHRAGLNLGDVFSYVLAVDRGDELLFKGSDFVHTDVRVAVARD